MNPCGAIWCSCPQGMNPVVCFCFLQKWSWGIFFPTGQQYKCSHPRKSRSFVRLKGWLAEHPEEGSYVPHWHCPSHPKDRTMAIKQIQAPSLSFICLVYKLAPRQKWLQWEWEGLVVLLQLRYLWELSQWGVKRRTGHSNSNGLWGQGLREAGDGQNLTRQVKPNLIQLQLGLGVWPGNFLLLL